MQDAIRCQQQRRKSHAGDNAGSSASMAYLQSTTNNPDDTEDQQQKPSSQAKACMSDKQIQNRKKQDGVDGTRGDRERVSHFGRI